MKSAETASPVSETMSVVQSPSLPLLSVAVFAALTSAGGFLRLPIPPVPFTLQTLFVYLSGDILGPKRGPQSQLIFLILGLMGIPVFALGGGPGYVMQPTFGYLAGFPAAAWAIGNMLRFRSRPYGWIELAAANAVGFIVIFAAGVIYLYINLNFIVHRPIPWMAALWSGVIIFVPGEVIKCIFAAFLTQRINSWINRI